MTRCMISAMIPLLHEYIYYRNNSIVTTILSRIEELQMVTQRIMPWDICYGYIDNPASCMSCDGKWRRSLSHAGLHRAI